MGVQNHCIRKNHTKKSVLHLPAQQIGTLNNYPIRYQNHLLYFYNIVRQSKKIKMDSTLHYISTSHTTTTTVQHPSHQLSLNFIHRSRNIYVQQQQQQQQRRRLLDVPTQGQRVFPAARIFVQLQILQYIHIPHTHTTAIHANEIDQLTR